MKKGCFISTIAVFVLLTAGLIFYFISQNRGETANMRTEKPVYMDISRKIVATGKIIPRQEINIKPQVSGVIDELFVEAGEGVEKGTQLARIQLVRSEEHTSELQSRGQLVCRLLLEK